MKDNKFYQMNTIKLAYIGDAVFSLFIREHFVKDKDYKNSELNKKVNAIVKATNQAKLMEEFMPALNEWELDIINRAKNLHFNNKAKNSSMAEYSKATQFEALIGFLYLTKQDERLNMFLDKCIKE